MIKSTLKLEGTFDHINPDLKKLSWKTKDHKIGSMINHDLTKLV